MRLSLQLMFYGAVLLVPVFAAAQHTDDAGIATAAVATSSSEEIPQLVMEREDVCGSCLAELPNAPLPQAGQSSSSGAQENEPSEHDKAAEQMKKQEHQRAFGIVPAFNTLYGDDAVPLSRVQKIDLAFHTSIDPFTFAEAALIGGYREIAGNYSGYGWGAQGYGKRVGSAYADSFLGNMLGNGVLPALLHQEPRYFRLGHGNVGHRFLYAAASAVRCRHDGSRKWEPNYSNVGGNILAGAISNVYYPEGETGWGHTFGDGLMNTATGIVGTVFQEFWMDLAQKMHKGPAAGAH